MTSFFPDVNIWLALSVEGHPHSGRAWQWLANVPIGRPLIFSRYTQLGFLRLLSNEAAMGDRALTLAEAWTAWDEWLADPRVEYRPEARALDAEFRAALEPFAQQKAWKWVGDGFVMAQAKSLGSTLVTFDAALDREARRQGCRCVVPSA